MDLSFLREWALVSLVILIQLIMLVGLFGLILPVFPGVLIIWLAALGYGILVGFNGLGLFLFILITISPRLRATPSPSERLQACRQARERS